MDFVAIDFETANHRRDSACQLAAVVVRDGVIADQQKWMIRPRPFYFSPRNIEVHGIRPADVDSAAEFGEIWPSIAPYLQETCLVAHNAPFDIGVLVECLRTHQLESAPLEFTCTRLISRAAWPGQSGYGLKRVAERLGIQFRHHDALEDSIACAKILLAAAKFHDVTSLEGLESRFKLVRGQASAAGYQGAKRATNARRPSARTMATQVSASRPSAFRPPVFRTNEGDYVAEPQTRYFAQMREVPAQEQDDQIDVQRLLIRAEFLRLLNGQRVVFAGRLRRLSRGDAERFAVRLGASLQSEITSETDLLVLGRDVVDCECSEIPIGEATVAAERLRAQGRMIRSITEDEFVGLV